MLDHSQKKPAQDILETTSKSSPINHHRYTIILGIGSTSIDDMTMSYRVVQGIIIIVIQATKSKPLV